MLVEVFVGIIFCRFVIFVVVISFDDVFFVFKLLSVLMYVIVYGVIFMLVGDEWIIVMKFIF